MKKIAVTGGKGGTGKSLVATALAVELAKKYKTLLIDADVDCPNDHFILDIKLRKEKNIYQSAPKWNFKKCIKCGKCSRVCKSNAIVFVKDRYPIFVSDLCVGCNACRIICPTKAITETKQQIGTIYSGKKHNINLITGEMRIGHEEAGPVVNALKRFASKKELRYDYIFVDTAAGTHCNVITALKNCDFALAVTEPTPLGAVDLELILKLAKELKIPATIILNKSNIGNKILIQKIADRYKTKIIAEIPYKKEILEAYSKGEPIKDKAIAEIAEKLI